MLNTLYFTYYIEIWLGTSYILVLPSSGFHLISGKDLLTKNHSGLTTLDNKRNICCRFSCVLFLSMCSCYVLNTVAMQTSVIAVILLYGHNWEILFRSSLDVSLPSLFIAIICMTFAFFFWFIKLLGILLPHVYYIFCVFEFCRWRRKRKL